MTIQVTILIDDGAIPNEWELERFGFAKVGETVIRYDSDGKALAHTLTGNAYHAELVIRKKYNPGVVLAKGCVVWRDGDDWIASKESGLYEDAVCGLQFLPEFTPPANGQPQKIC